MGTSNSINTASPKMQDLARRLLALEAAQGGPSDQPVDEAVRACERLRVLISKFVGVAGFGSLLSRALSLAKAEVPSLGMVRVRPDGTLEGFAENERDRVRGEGAGGGDVLVAWLLGLLVTFIGLSLTLALVRDAWPELTLDGMELDTGKMS